MKTISEIKDAIYQLLYEKSRVDGIRYCNEDEWPTEEIANLVEKQIREAKKEAVNGFFLEIAKLAEPDERQFGAGELMTSMDEIHRIRNSYLESLDTTKGQP